MPARIALDRRDQRLRQVGGEGRREALVGDHLQLALLARAREHPRDEVAALRRAAVQAVEARACARPARPGA